MGATGGSPASAEFSKTYTEMKSASDRRVVATTALSHRIRLLGRLSDTSATTLSVVVLAVHQVNGNGRVGCITLIMRVIPVKTHRRSTEPRSDRTRYLRRHWRTSRQWHPLFPSTGVRSRRLRTAHQSLPDPGFPDRFRCWRRWRRPGRTGNRPRYHRRVAIAR